MLVKNAPHTSTSIRKISNFTINRDHINKNKKTKVVTYTPEDILVGIELGIKCPLEYLQVYR